MVDTGQCTDGRPMYHMPDMQTDVATKKLQAIEKMEAGKRSAAKWRTRFLWLTFILPVLTVPGYVFALNEYPYLPRSVPRDLGGIVAPHAVSLTIILLLLLGFVRPLAKPSIYGSTMRFYAFIGLAFGLSIAHGFYWFLFGFTVLAANADHSDIGIAIWYLAVAPILAAIALLVGGVVGLLHGWFLR